MQQYQPKLILPSLQAAALTWTPQRSVSEQKELILELTLSLWWLYSHKHDLDHATHGADVAGAVKQPIEVLNIS